MEENENKPVEVAGLKNEATEAEKQAVMEDALGEESAQPSRDEILAISRDENKKGDERELQVHYKAMNISYAVGVIIIGLIFLITAILGRGGKATKELMMVYMGMTATWSLYDAIKSGKSGKRRALYLTCGIICTIACLFYLVFWILELCGVDVI